jgi:hypothetical protein
MILEADFKHFIFHGAYRATDAKDARGTPVVGVLEKR